MATIEVPVEGRPTDATDSADLLGVDGNAFSVIATTKQLLKRAGASREFCEGYTKRAMASGSYDELLALSVAYLDSEGGDSQIFNRNVES